MNKQITMVLLTEGDMGRMPLKGLALTGLMGGDSVLDVRLRLLGTDMGDAVIQTQ